MNKTSHLAEKKESFLKTPTGDMITKLEEKILEGGSISVDEAICLIQLEGQDIYRLIASAGNKITF